MLTSYQQILIEHVKRSIANAQLEQSKLSPEILALQGMSSNKIRHFLNNICSLDDLKYLEIGIWKGATFISALYQNSPVAAIAIDNWSEFLGTKEIFTANVAQFLPQISYQIQEADCFTFDTKNIHSKINIYFYDAGHTRFDHERAFTHFDPLFEDIFIAIVDNYNWIQVQEGTQDAFKKLNYTVLFDQFLKANHRADAAGWWTGLYVAVISKNKA